LSAIVNPENIYQQLKNENADFLTSKGSKCPNIHKQNEKAIMYLKFFVFDFKE
jgi:hypothetical protein